MLTKYMRTFGHPLWKFEVFTAMKIQVVVFWVGKSLRDVHETLVYIHL